MPCPACSAHRRRSQYPAGKSHRLRHAHPGRSCPRTPSGWGRPCRFVAAYPHFTVEEVNAGLADLGRSIRRGACKAAPRAVSLSVSFSPAPAYDSDSFRGRNLSHSTGNAGLRRRANGRSRMRARRPLDPLVPAQPFAACLPPGIGQWTNDQARNERGPESKLRASSNRGERIRTSDLLNSISAQTAQLVITDTILNLETANRVRQRPVFPPISTLVVVGLSQSSAPHSYSHATPSAIRRTVPVSRPLRTKAPDTSTRPRGSVASPHGPDAHPPAEPVKGQDESR
jgi:hypothetical protein